MKTEKQSLGEFFTETRKDKGVSLDEIVRDTNIPKRYLESIEADNFEVFPGETYAMGFIANYADALEVDRDLVINMYKRQMKIEQDAPLEELVGKKSTFVINNNILSIGGAVLGIFLVVLLITLAVRQSRINEEKQEKNRMKEYAYALADIGNIINQKYRIGDTITISNEQASNLKTVQLHFSSVGPGKTLSLKINNNNYTMKSGELISVDSDFNGTNDLGVELIMAKEKEIKLSITALKETLGPITNISSDNLYSQFREYILSENEILTTNFRTEMTMKVVSSGIGYFGYAPDNRESKEVYLNNGSSLSVGFASHLIVYFGNSGAVKMIIGGKEETGGGWGEVGKSVFYWKEKNGLFTLVRAVLK